MYLISPGEGPKTSHRHKQGNIIFKKESTVPERVVYSLERAVRPALAQLSEQDFP